MALAQRSAVLDSVGHGELAGLAGFFFATKPMITLVAVRVLGLSSQEGSGLRLATAFALFGLTALATFGAGSLRRPWTSPVKWAWTFLALAGSSLVWGQAASPLVSGAYWLGTVCELGAVLLIMRCADVEQSAAAMMKGFAWGAIIVACTAWVMPVQYDLRLGDEEYFNSNNIAYVCAFAAFFVQYLMRRRKGSWGWVLVLMTATILRSLSKATIAAFVLSQAWLLLQPNSMNRRSKATVGGIGLLLFAAFSGLFVAYFNVYTSFGNQSETLTGRTAIWAWAFDEAMQRPWLGHGFDAMWKVAPIFGTFEARHAENELLQQFYSFGIAGVAAAAACYVSLWRAIRKAVNQSGRAIWGALVIFVVVRGLAEAEPFDLLLPLWLIALLARIASAGGCTVDDRNLPVPFHKGAPAGNVIRL